MFKKVQKLIKSAEVKKLYPIKKKVKADLDVAIKNVLNNSDPRRLLIIGPCSLDNSDAVFQYLEKLKSLQEMVKEKLLFVPRLYTAKPRSHGGYTGLLHSQSGITKCRKILCKAVNTFNFAVADELLYPQMHEYFSDAISYYSVGARSSINQEHKFFASGIDVAVGFKNPMNGNLGSLADSIAVSMEKNRFFCGGYEVETGGNPYSHGILRGFNDNKNTKFSNFDIESVVKFAEACEKRNMSNVPLIIDFNHDNSGKNYIRQLDVAKAVTQNLQDADYAKTVKGFMVESYLVEGKGGGFGCSLTDGCLSFDQTQKAVLQLCEKL